MNPLHHNTHTRRGVTLVELMVVVTILMIMGILFLANASTIARLRGYLRHVEGQQIERIAPR